MTMRTKSHWLNEMVAFFDPTTQETVLPMGPLLFYDDFVGPGSVVIPAAGAAESGCPWVKKIQDTIGTAAFAGIANASSGVVAGGLDVTVEKQEAAIYHDDQRNFSLEYGLLWEARIKAAAIPTAGTTGELVFGLVGDYADGPDAITYSAFFTLDGSATLLCEVDDDASNQSASAAMTIVNTDWHVYRMMSIPHASGREILFFVDGNQVATGTTFVYAATGANAVLQPYLGVYKTAAGLGTIHVDYVRIWGLRS